MPAAVTFKKQGANRGAIASFLVSTPESGIDSIAITYALLDPIMTVVRPIAAFVSGITVGIVENCMVSSGNQYEDLPSARLDPLPQSAAADPEQTSFGSKLYAGMKFGFVSVWGDIVFWFFGGLLLAGLITVYLPDHLSEMVLGGGIISMLAMLLVGMPIYICATASTPVAAALLLKGASPGAVLVFLLVGPATNMTSLSVLIRLLGKRGTIRYLIGIAVVSIAFGLGVDVLYEYLAIEPRAIIAEVREVLPSWLKLGAAVVVILLSLAHGYGWIRNKRQKKGENTFVSGFPALQQAPFRERAKQHVEIRRDSGRKKG